MTADQSAVTSEAFAACVCCPQCRSALTSLRLKGLTCRSCDVTYPVERGVYRLLGSAGAESSSAAFYNSPDDGRYGRRGEEIAEDVAAPVHDFLAAIKRTDVVAELGPGRGPFHVRANCHIAVDLSLVALAALEDGIRVQADAQALPFRSASIDAMFSVAMLEHIPEPERVLAEIDRCLRPGGRALLYPAWYVRPWTSSGLHLASYRELGARNRLRKLSIPVRNSRLMQFAGVFPRRALAESRVARGQHIGLSFQRLHPNLEAYVTTDSDAFVSLDPHAVASYFRSRGYTIVGYETALSRVFYRYEPVVIRKPHAAL